MVVVVVGHKDSGYHIHAERAVRLTGVERGSDTHAREISAARERVTRDRKRERHRAKEREKARGNEKGQRER